MSVILFIYSYGRPAQMGSGLPGSLPSHILYYLLLYISSLANKIVVVDSTLDHAATRLSEQFANCQYSIRQACVVSWPLGGRQRSSSSVDRPS